MLPSVSPLCHLGYSVAGHVDECVRLLVSVFTVLCSLSKVTFCVSFFVTLHELLLAVLVSVYNVLVSVFTVAWHRQAIFVTFYCTTCCTARGVRVYSVLVSVIFVVLE